MEITNVEFKRIYDDESNKLRALLNITLDNELVIREVRIIKGTNRLFIAMPSRVFLDGSFKDVVHPICQKMRSKIEIAVFTEYEKQINQSES